jgi:hypothetical protein
MPNPNPDPPPVNILAERTQDELLDMWAANRNNLTGLMAAEEIVRRIFLERKMKP